VAAAGYTDPAPAGGLIGRRPSARLGKSAPPRPSSVFSPLAPCSTRRGRLKSLKLPKPVPLLTIPGSGPHDAGVRLTPFRR
jgi:hypothetical protein